jgi:hypothetical protein
MNADTCLVPKARTAARYVADFRLGQNGHPGETLRRSETPDAAIDHP